MKNKLIALILLIIVITSILTSCCGNGLPNENYEIKYEVTDNKNRYSTDDSVDLTTTLYYKGKKIKKITEKDIRLISSYSDVNMLEYNKEKITKAIILYANSVHYPSIKDNDIIIDDENITTNIETDKNTNGLDYDEIIRRKKVEKDKKNKDKSWF